MVKPAKAKYWHETDSEQVREGKEKSTLKRVKKTVMGSRAKLM